MAREGVLGTVVSGMCTAASPWEDPEHTLHPEPSAVFQGVDTQTVSIEIERPSLSQWFTVKNLVAFMSCFPICRQPSTSFRTCRKIGKATE